MSEFWTLIEQARTNAFDGNDTWLSDSAIFAALVDRLMQLPLERIVQFHRCYWRAAHQAHQWRVCASAFLICSYISDDTFIEFKAGLIGLGQDAFEQVVNDPDILADHPMVRAIAAGQLDRFALTGSIGAVAPEAYDRRMGDDADAFWDALDTQLAEDSDGEDTSDETWSGRFGDPEDIAQIRLRLPRLHALFSSSGT